MNLREHAKRRRQLMDFMGADGVAVLPAAPQRIRSRDTSYSYRQDSDFYYLTGFGEPEAVAVLAPGRPQGEYILFCRERDAVKEMWEGMRAGPAGAIELYGADDAFPIADVDEILPGLLQHCERVYYSIGAGEFDARLLNWIKSLNQKRQSSHAPSELIALDHVLHEARLYKSRVEIGVMRRSARIAVAAHRRAMSVCRPGMMEFELEAEYLHEFRRNGAVCSYPPIVAGGANACVLHYTANDAVLADGDLVLVDAGCELEMYASDVTRTFPVNGRFSERQRELYDIVLEANRAAIAAVRPGNHWNDPHDAAVKQVTLGLRRLGMLEGRVPSLIKEQAYRRYFMHKTGHWLGIDVHDVGDYKLANEWRLLEPGMVLTIEPGIYVAADSKGKAKPWRGIGIRIEDDVVVTRDGCDVLTAALPVDADEIERCVGSALGRAV